MIPRIPAPKHPLVISNDATDASRKQAKAAAHALSQAFVWDDTAEGVDFWVAVNKRLLQIAEDGQLK
jgi:hypothetical protein